MKALVGAFNQGKALVGAFSVIVQPVVEPIDRFTALVQRPDFRRNKLLPSVVMIEAKTVFQPWAPPQLRSLPTLTLTIRGAQNHSLN